MENTVHYHRNKSEAPNVESVLAEWNLSGSVHKKKKFKQQIREEKKNKRAKMALDRLPDFLRLL